MPTKRKVMTPKFPGTVRTRAPITNLKTKKAASIRTEEIWRLISLGKSDNAIAKELGVSLSSIRGYVTILKNLFMIPQDSEPRVWLALEYMKRNIIKNGLN